MLIKNIITASESYYIECEYGDLSDKSKYGEEYACEINGSNIETSLGALANTGMLKVNDLNKKKKKKIVKDPKTDKNISDCYIVITKVITTTPNDNGIENKKVTYSVKPLSGSEAKCPEKYQGE